MNGDFLWKFDRGRYGDWDNEEDEEIEARKMIANYHIDYVNRMHEIDGFWSDSYAPVVSGSSHSRTNEDIKHNEKKIREIECEIIEWQEKERQLAEKRRLEEEARKPFIEKKSNNRKIFVIKGGVE